MNPENFKVIVDFIVSLWAPALIVFEIFGGLVVLGTVIDKMVPDTYDKGFMKKVMTIPVLGDFLNFITKFSPFNAKH